MKLSPADCLLVLRDEAAELLRLSGIANTRSLTAAEMERAGLVASRINCIFEEIVPGFDFIASSAFLRTPEWRRIRMDVLVRDGAICACCGRRADKQRAINVDHIKPRRDAPHLALDPANLQVLCDDCNAGKGNRYETDWRAGELRTRVSRSFRDRVAWMLLLESAWWEVLSGADHAFLCALAGWHGEAFRFIDRQTAEHGRQPWAALRERIAGEAWGEPALALVDGEDPAIEPLLDDLRNSMAQLRGAESSQASADAKLAADRVLGRL